MNFLSPEKTIRAMHQGRYSISLQYIMMLLIQISGMYKDVLLDWHYYDPVNDWELNRTWALHHIKKTNLTHLY